MPNYSGRGRPGRGTFTKTSGLSLAGTRSAVRYLDAACPGSARPGTNSAISIRAAGQGCAARCSNNASSACETRALFLYLLHYFGAGATRAQCCQLQLFVHTRCGGEARPPVTARRSDTAAGRRSKNKRFPDCAFSPIKRSPSFLVADETGGEQERAFVCVCLPGTV